MALQRKPQVLAGIVAISVFSITLPVATNVHAETSTTQLRQQTRTQLRLESTSKEGQENDDAVAALCDLYVVLRSDPRYETSEMLQGDAAKVRRRLLTVARRREIQLGRKGVPRPAEMARHVDAEIESAIASEAKVSDQLDRNSDSSSVGGGAPGGAAAGAGWQLVELIERIVAPDFWESRGGVGSIRYFAMRRVLVVRATSDVHQQVKDLLMALR